MGRSRRALTLRRYWFRRQGGRLCARVSLHAIASVMIDRVGGENLPPPRDVRDARSIESAPVSIVRDLVSIGIADRAVRSWND
jgi:hypothetical protein